MSKIFLIDGIKIKPRQFVQSDDSAMVVNFYKMIQSVILIGYFPAFLIDYKLVVPCDKK